MDLFEGESINPLILQRIRYFSEINQAVRYIEQHISEHITLEMVSTAAHFEQTAFSKAFRRRTGVTFRDFVHALRIIQALERMKTSNLHLTEIAFEVGFSSLSAFERTFRKLMGTSPSKYRKLALMHADRVPFAKSA